MPHARSLRHAALVALLPLTGCLIGCPAPQAEEAAPAGAAPAPASEATLFVIRHAQALKNVAHPPDTPPEQLDALTPTGEEQARALGAALQGRGVTRVLTSPAGRARETAARVAAALGLEVEVAAGLAELARGGAAGPTGPSMMAAAAGGESLAEGVARALAAIEPALQPGEGVVVVTHGDIAAGLIGHAAGTPPAESWPKHEPPTGSLSELRRDGQTWRLGPLGVTPRSER